MQLAGRSVLLTGATGGIGHAIARRLAADGAHLVLSGRRTEVLEPLAAELGARVVAADLAELDAPQRLIAAAGEIHALVANAGLPASGRLEDFTAEEVDRALAVNLRAPIQLARLLGPEMAARGDGALVFVSSLAGKAGVPGAALYSATKFGLRGLALSLREDLRDSGINASAVFPGFIRDAGMFADADVKLPRGVGTKAPDDVAAAVVRAIQSGPAEIDVAPVGLRVGAALAGLAPELAANLARRMGGHDVGRQLGDAQRSKR